MEQFERFSVEKRGFEDPRFGTIDVLFSRSDPSEKIFVKKKTSPSLAAHRSALFNSLQRLELKHQNILRMIEVLHNEPCLVVETYFEYPPERSASAAKLRWSPKKILRFLHDCLQGLCFLEGNRMVHGNIRPEFIHFNSKKNRFVILDRLNEPFTPIESQMKSLKSGKNVYLPPLIFQELSQNNSKPKHNPFKIEVYCLCMTLLSFLHNDEKDFQEIYDRRSGKFNQEKFSAIREKAKVDFFSEGSGVELGDIIFSNFLGSESGSLSSPSAAMSQLQKFAVKVSTKSSQQLRTSQPVEIEKRDSIESNKPFDFLSDLEDENVFMQREEVRNSNPSSEYQLNDLKFRESGLISERLAENSNPIEQSDESLDNVNVDMVFERDVDKRLQFQSIKQVDFMAGGDLQGSEGDVLEIFENDSAENSLIKLAGLDQDLMKKELRSLRDVYSSTGSNRRYEEERWSAAGGDDLPVGKGAFITESQVLLSAVEGSEREKKEGGVFASGGFPDKQDSSRDAGELFNIQESVRFQPRPSPEFNVDFFQAFVGKTGQVSKFEAVEKKGAVNASGEGKGEQIAETENSEGNFEDAWYKGNNGIVRVTLDPSCPLSEFASKVNSESDSESDSESESEDALNHPSKFQSEPNSNPSSIPPSSLPSSLPSSVPSSIPSSNPASMPTSKLPSRRLLPPPALKHTCSKFKSSSVFASALFSHLSPPQPLNGSALNASALNRRVSSPSHSWVNFPFVANKQR